MASHGMLDFHKMRFQMFLNLGCHCNQKRVRNPDRIHGHAGSIGDIGIGDIVHKSTKIRQLIFGTDRMRQKLYGHNLFHI